MTSRSGQFRQIAMTTYLSNLVGLLDTSHCLMRFVWKDVERCVLFEGLWLQSKAFYQFTESQLSSFATPFDITTAANGIVCSGGIWLLQETSRMSVMQPEVGQHH